MGKDEQRQHRFLIKLLLTSPVKKEKVPSLSDINLKELLQQQRVSRMINSLEGWTAETQRLTEQTH